MTRRISERKYIIYHIASLFKFYETTFGTVNFEWVETHAHAAKMLKSSTNSGIVLVDAKATRVSDGLDVWHMEVAGPPWNATNVHTVGDTKKTFRTDVVNLIEVLKNHLDCEVKIATKIKVFCMLGIGE